MRCSSAPVNLQLMAVRKRTRIEATVAAIATAAGNPDSTESKRLLRDALAHENWYVVSEAAAVVGESHLHELETELGAVWRRFAGGSHRVDPGCRAKCAALTALDRLESFDPDPFLHAVRFVQLEPVAGGRVDTAGGVRQRALYALLRMCHVDALLHAGQLLADPDAQVRAGVAAGLGHYGSREAAGLLLFKLELGDDDPAVIVEAATALLRVAPEFGLRFCGNWLRHDEALRREAACLALGQSERPEGIALLLGMLEDGLGDDDFSVVARALGLTRDEEARRALLDVVTHGAKARAETAVHSLAVHSYDPKLAERVKEAAASSPHPELLKLVSRVFRD